MVKSQEKANRADVRKPPDLTLHFLSVELELELLSCDILVDNLHIYTIEKQGRVDK